MPMPIRNPHVALDLPDAEVIWEWLWTGPASPGSGEAGVVVPGARPTVDDVAAFVDYIQRALATLPEEVRTKLDCEWSFPGGRYLLWAGRDDVENDFARSVVWEVEDEPADVYGADDDAVKDWREGLIEYYWAYVPHPGEEDPHARRRHHLSSLGMVSFLTGAGLDAYYNMPKARAKAKREQDEYRQEVERDLAHEAYAHQMSGRVLVQQKNAPGGPLDFPLDFPDEGVRERAAFFTKYGAIFCGRPGENYETAEAVFGGADIFGARTDEPLWFAHENVPAELYDEIVATGQWAYPRIKQGPRKGAVPRHDVSRRKHPWRFIGAPHPAWIRSDGKLDKLAFGWWLSDEWRRELNLPDHVGRMPDGSSYDPNVNENPGRGRVLGWPIGEYEPAPTGWRDVPIQARSATMKRWTRRRR